MQLFKNINFKVRAAIIVTLLCSPVFLYALPEGESVIEGTATFDRSDSNVLKINTSSDNLIVEYGSFNITANESVYFTQPSAISAALNRVIGSGASDIAGVLFANGIFYLINPNGINIASTATIDVAGLVASTLNISNADFLQGNYSFYKIAGKNAFILNQGNIIVRNGGYVSLLSQAVENRGTITANLGTVVLASGEKMTLALDDLNEISVVIDEAVKEAVLGANGEKILSAVKNSGTITANGGKVILTAKALNNVFDYAINNTGVIEAKSVVNHNGVVELIADGAPVVNTGRIQAGAHIFIQANDVLQGGLISAEGKIDIEAETVEVILKDNPDAILLDPLVHVSPGVIIQASQVKITARQFGSWSTPLKIDAPLTYLYSKEGNIDISDSLGIGTSIMLRGPPDGFGAILYNKDANLALEASHVSLVGVAPAYLYGNITFYNFTCTIPDKEIYFEAGKTYTFKGNLSITGAADIGPDEFFIKLRAQEAGKYWYLNIESKDYVLDKVNISDAYALSLVQIPEGVDAGNNVNFEIDPTWDGEGLTDNWSDAVNWSGNSLPTSATDATFNATSVKNSIVDAAFGGTIRDLLVNAGYTGTITFVRSLSVRDFTQAAGTVSLGAQTLTLSRNFSLSAGTFNANSGTVNIAKNFTISGTGVFNEGISTVTFTGAGATINVLTSETFFNLTFAPTTAGATKTVSASDTLIVTGTLTLTEGNINQGTIPASGTISARGDITQASTFEGGSGLLIITGSDSQTFTGNSTTTAGDLTDLTIDKNGGTLTLAGTIRTSGQGADAWTYIAGTVDATTNDSLVVFNNASTIDAQGSSAAMAFDNVEFRGGTATLAGNLDVDGNLTIASGATLNVSTTDFSVNVAGNWSNSGTFNAQSGTVTFDGSGNATITSGGTGTSKDFFNVIIDKGGGATLQLLANGLDINNALTISQGVLYLNGQNITTTTTFSNNGTLKLIGIETVSWAVNDTDSGTWEYAGRNLAETISIKDFGATDYFNLVINDTNTNKATFSSGSDKVILGAFTVSSGNQITFTAGTTLTIAGTLTLTGTSGNLIVLRSSVSGSEWNIDPQGAVSISFVDVKDSNNINAAVITASDSKDSGNNTNWNLVDHFVITAGATQVAGTAGILTITAIDGVGGTALSYTGDKLLVFSGANSIGSFAPTVTDKFGSAVDFSSATTITFTNGVSTAGGSMVLYKVESASISVTQGAIATPVALIVTVNAAVANKLLWLVQPSSPVTAGDTWNTFSIEITDLFGNRRTVDTSAITVTPSIGAFASGTATKNAVAGVANFNDLTYNIAGTITLTADAAGLTSAPASNNIVVNAGAVAAADNANSAFINSQLSHTQALIFIFSPAAQVEQYQINPFIPIGGFTYLYHPLTPTDMSAFEEFILADKDYNFADGELNLLGHAGLNAFFMK